MQTNDTVMKNMKCLVIGANGYIGKHIVKYLTNCGSHISACDIQACPSIKDIQYIQTDITDIDQIKKIDFSVDLVFHFSGITGTYNGFDEYNKYISLNETGLLNVLDCIRKSPTRPRIIYPSTRLVYKGSDKPIREDDEKEVKTIYSLNKLSGEYILSAYQNAFDIPYTICRICVPYGNLIDDDYSFGTIGFFLSKAKKNNPISLYGDGNLKRTFTHIEDVCEQIIQLSLIPKSINQIFNIKGETFSLKEAATFIAQKYNVPIEFIPWPKNDLLIESGSTVFNNDKIDTILKRPLKNNLFSWINNDLLMRSDSKSGHKLTHTVSFPKQ